MAGGPPLTGLSSRKTSVSKKFQRPPIIEFGGNSIKCVTSTDVLVVKVGASLSFAQYTESIEERATIWFGEMSKVSASW